MIGISALRSAVVDPETMRSVGADFQVTGVSGFAHSQFKCLRNLPITMHSDVLVIMAALRSRCRHYIFVL